MQRNGLVRNYVIDYGDFSINARLTEAEEVEAKTCAERCFRASKTHVPSCCEAGGADQHCIHPIIQHGEVRVATVNLDVARPFAGNAVGKPV